MLEVDDADFVGLAQEKEVILLDVGVINVTAIFPDRGQELPQKRGEWPFPTPREKGTRLRWSNIQ